ncbi:SDR family NAD(P)-dependent oxidoreductase [Psychromicrobium lacuslunae]|uniref:Short-chain dehydrogenase n=1 Tax=Psychromicrobium lacuslunae TaxID=1618207 RepID=A0A0D4C214_9MICC|nr:SDR family oxidoreductase [Psychromicrobium lacuslunae]AJT42455.1 short-chain dehydrogenase [Psychromicrobium lacuslunae]
MHALITGASRGIGRGIAEHLASQGWHLLISGRNLESLEEARQALLSLGAAQVLTVPAEMASDQDLQAILDAQSAWSSRLDALILSAGVGTAGTVAEYPSHRYDKTFAVDVRAPFKLIQGTLPALRAAAAARPEIGAKVIALASIAGVHAEPGLAAYGAAKAALISLIAGLNAEESASGVSGTALSPGYVDTEMSAWTRQTIPQQSMIPVSDLVEIVAALLRMSPRTVLSNIVLNRAGEHGGRA